MDNSTGSWNTRALRRLGAVVLLVAASTVACTDQTPGPTPTPTPPPTTTDTFTDTLKVNGAFSYPFPVVAVGSLTATLTSVSDATIAVSFSVGTWNGASCQVVIPVDKALQGTVIPAVVTAVGTYCVRISDAGLIVDPVTFQISVVHP